MPGSLPAVRQAASTAHISVTPDTDVRVLLNIVVGIIGALLGGWLLSLAGIDGTSGIIVSFLTALLGACLLLFVVKAVVRRA